MSERLSRVRYKIKRAKKHIVDLEQAICRFLDTDLYVCRHVRDREGVIHIERVDPVPPEIGLIFGDAIHNLRSALDHLAYALVQANNCTPTKKTYFPISETFQKHGTPETLAKVHGMSQAAINLIDATKPYGGGNDDLWALHCLDNIDKHRLLVTAATSLAGFGNVRGDAGEEFRGDFRMGAKKWAKIRRAEGVDSDESTPVTEQYTHMTVTITLAEPQILQAKGVLEFSQKLLHLVDGIITQFEPLL